MSKDMWQRQLSDLVNVMAAWYKSSEAVSDAPLDLAMAYRSAFSPIGSGDPSGALKSFESTGDPTKWFHVPGYFAAASLRVRSGIAGGYEHCYPLLALALRVQNAQLMITLRAALFWERDNRVHGWGWRFESPDIEAEVGEFTHPYYHIQHIATWEKGGSGLAPPNGLIQPPLQPVETEHATPESKPAFPLACRSAAGLVVAAMISLYGPRSTASILRSFSSMDAEFLTLVGMTKLELI